jgi:hypothetical protein
MPRIIPFFAGSFFTQQVPLDGVVYTLDFHWNNRAESWTLTIRDVEQNLILAGIRLVQGIDMLSQYQSYEIPPGELYIFDFSGDFSDIKRDDFTNDRDLKLIYFTEAEIG